MKSLLILTAFLTVHAYAAFDVCQFEDTVAFDEAVEAKKLSLIYQADDHKKWTILEKKMIHATITSDDYHANVNQNEALRTFGDYYEDNTEEGANSGSIQYYKVGAYKFVLVHYWPGDNEVGAFLEVDPKGKIKILATISDQWVECKR